MAQSEPAQTEAEIAYLGTVHLTYQTGDTLSTDNGDPYVAIGPSQWYQEMGIYETPCLPYEHPEAQAILKKKWSEHSGRP